MPTPHLKAPVMPGSEDTAEAKDDSSTGDSRAADASEPKQFNSAAELTKALRSIGLSKAAAKAVVSGGWPALQQLSGSAEPEPDYGDMATSLRAAITALEHQK